MRGPDLNRDPSAFEGMQTAEAMREAFDSAFTQPRASRVSDLEALLLIRVDRVPMALRVRELGGLHECPAVTHVPSAYPAQLGLVGLQSTLVATYSLSALLARDRPRTGRWIALCAQDRTIGFVFDELEGYLQVGRDRLHKQGGGQASDYAAEVVMVGGVARPLLEVPALVAAVRLRLEEENSKWSG